MDYSSIPNFYQGRCIFVTGATGFMGKILVQKLLRSCPEIDQIYLLLRPLAGKTAASRLEELIKNEVRTVPILFYYFSVDLRKNPLRFSIGLEIIIPRDLISLSQLRVMYRQRL